MSCRVSAPHASMDKPSLGISISPKCTRNTLATKEWERKEAKLDPTPEQVFLLCSFFNDILLFFSLIAFD